MPRRIFFALWRCALIALLGLALKQLYGWQPSDLLVLVLVGLAVDSVVSLLLLKD